MQQFMRLSPIKAISFDLDDTLYDNRPIMEAAETALLEWLAEHYPLTQQLQPHDWIHLKKQLINDNPMLKHDTSLSRLTLLKTGLFQLGYTLQQSQVGATDGLAYFLNKRSDFRVDDDVLLILNKLKSRFILISISNGNVSTQKIGIAPFFCLSLHPGNNVKMKPCSDMFNIACQQFDIAPNELLHVGDNAKTDVDGARKAGCQTALITPSYGSQELQQPQTLLPHIVLSSLEEILFTLEMPV